METAVPQTKGNTLGNNLVLRPWQGTALGILCLIGILLIALFVGKLGYEGFKAGEAKRTECLTSRFERRTCPVK